MPLQTVFLASPRGFCAGVERAIDILRLALETFGPPVYVRNHIVHNVEVVREFEAKGAIFVKTVAEIPDGSNAVLSAHGSPSQWKSLLESRNIRVLDAVCPLVTKVHREAKKYADEGFFILYVGHKGHPEPEGVLSNVKPRQAALIENLEQALGVQPAQTAKLIALTQTTLSFDDTRSIIDALKSRFPMLVTPPTFDICYATQNRQNAVKAMADAIDVLIVVGSKHSSNSNRLRDVGEMKGIPSHLVDSAGEIEPGWLAGKTRLGLTSGASVPEHLVEGVVNRLRAWFPDMEVREIEVTKETATFPMPKELERKD